MKMCLCLQTIFDAFLTRFRVFNDFHDHDLPEFFSVQFAQIRTKIEMLLADEISLEKTMHCTNVVQRRLKVSAAPHDDRKEDQARDPKACFYCKQVWNDAADC